ncbi:MAG: glycosyltransferase family 4 protein [Leptospiraceae bacterium]|nr:glycosyltransferase family 4 protein [Leptospiraceae bacterium]
MQLEVKYKPRIAIDARPLSYGLTGNSRYLFEVLKYLIRKDSHFEYYLYSNKEIHPMFMDFIKDNSVQVPIIKKVPGVLWLNFILPYLLHRDRIDLFWGTLQLLPYFKLPIPEFVNYHDLNFKSAPDTMTRSNFLQHRLLSGKTLQNANTVFCLSKNTKKEIAEYKPEFTKKLKVIYPGVSKKIIKNEEIAIKGKFLFTIGTLEPRKNIATVIESYLLLKKERPNFEYKLVIASRRGWGQESLTQKLLSGELEKDGIIFLESPNDELLNVLYKKSSLFLFPSIHEGFGLPLLEAMLEQKVCIASDIPVFREILDLDSDILVSALDVNEWKNAILTATDRNSVKRRRVWDEKQWTWIATASQIEESFLIEWHKKLDSSVTKNAV